MSFWGNWETWESQLEEIKVVTSSRPGFRIVDLQLSDYGKPETTMVAALSLDELVTLINQLQSTLATAQEKP